jgi:hypothetical protein
MMQETDVKTVRSPALSCRGLALRTARTSWMALGGHTSCRIAHCLPMCALRKLDAPLGS